MDYKLASDELALLGNLPAIDDRQAAHNNHQQLVGLIQGLSVRLDTVERDLNVRFENVNMRFNDVNMRFNDINIRLENMDARVISK